MNVSAGRNEPDKMTHNTELNQIQQCADEGFRRERAVGYEGFERIESL